MKRAPRAPLTPQAIAFIQSLAVSQARIDHERDIGQQRQESATGDQTPATGATEKRGEK